MCIYIRNVLSMRWYAKNCDIYTMCKKEGEVKLKYSGAFFLICMVG